MNARSDARIAVAIAPFAAFATLALAAALGGGCAPSSGFDGRVFRNVDVSFAVPAVPSGWSRVDLPDAAIAFRDDGRAASILVNARCRRKDDDVPLPVLVEHLIMGTTDRSYVSEETVPMDGREARHSVLLAKLDGVPMQYDIVVMKKNDCVFDFVYVAEPQRFTEGSGAFEQFVRGVHVMDTRGER